METTLNSSKFANRLQKIMEAHELSATAFAEKLSVGRATISHLMSGRNKPSLDFVMKVVSTFPEVTLNELIFDLKTPTTLGHSRAGKMTQFKGEKSAVDFEASSQASFRESAKNTSQKSIERIVMFYSDGTFTTHVPDESQ